MEAPPRYTISKYLKRYFVCKCDCGTIKQVRLQELKNGQIKSCGCLQKEILKKLKEFRKTYMKVTQNEFTMFS
jgi:hypothetical protein